MAKTSQILEDALRVILTNSNLPSRYADFQALTRDLIRQLAPHAVILAREEYASLLRRGAAPSTTLEETTAHFKAHNDMLEARLSVPPTFTIQQLTDLGNGRIRRKV